MDMNRIMLIVFDIKCLCANIQLFVIYMSLYCIYVHDSYPNIFFICQTDIIDMMF